MQPRHVGTLLLCALAVVPAPVLWAQSRTAAQLPDATVGANDMPVCASGYEYRRKQPQLPYECVLRQDGATPTSGLAGGTQKMIWNGWSRNVNIPQTPTWINKTGSAAWVNVSGGNHNAPGYSGGPYNIVAYVDGQQVGYVASNVQQGSQAGFLQFVVPDGKKFYVRSEPYGHSAGAVNLMATFFGPEALYDVTNPISTDYGQCIGTGVQSSRQYCTGQVTYRYQIIEMGSQTVTRNYQGGVTDVSSQQCVAREVTPWIEAIDSEGIYCGGVGGPGGVPK